MMITSITMAEFSVKFSLNPDEHQTAVTLLFNGVIALERMRDDMLNNLEIDFDNVDEEAVAQVEFVNNEIAIAKTIVEKLTVVDN